MSSAKDRMEAEDRHNENTRSAAKGHRLNIFIAVVAVLALVFAMGSFYLQLKG